MRNYPNMSYCMFENTQGAMNQLAEFMIEADQDDVLDISRTELRAMQELVGYCEQYIRLVEEFEERRQAILSGCAEDEMETF
jgi:hypothetical protein